MNDLSIIWNFMNNKNVSFSYIFHLKIKVTWSGSQIIIH